jgi:hypothetical protein
LIVGMSLAVRPATGSAWWLAVGDSFGSLAEVEAGLLAFQDYCQQSPPGSSGGSPAPALTLLFKRLAAYEPGPVLAGCPPVNTSPKFRARALSAG